MFLLQRSPTALAQEPSTDARNEPTPSADPTATEAADKAAGPDEGDAAGRSSQEESNSLKPIYYVPPLLYGSGEVEPKPASRPKEKTPPGKQAKTSFNLDDRVGTRVETTPELYLGLRGNVEQGYRTLLRGFDDTQGNNTEFRVAGVPLNQPSHLYAQGFAELGIVIPELVSRSRVQYGVYNPRQGDFATAGSVYLDLGVPDRGLIKSFTYGSFQTYRTLFLWAPEQAPEETFGAFVYQRTSGYGAERRGRSANALAQMGFGSGSFKGLVHFGLFGSWTRNAGVLRRDDLVGPAINFFDVYDDPAAAEQSRVSTRGQMGLTLSKAFADDAEFRLGLWTAFSDFRLTANSTGYWLAEQAGATGGTTAEGLPTEASDLQRLDNEVFALGGESVYRGPRLRPVSWAEGYAEVGFSGRTDFIDQSHSLLRAPGQEPWLANVDEDVNWTDIAAWLASGWQLSQYVRVFGGFRADALYHDIEDALANDGAGAQSDALDIKTGVRGYLELLPVEWLVLRGALGTGFQSIQVGDLAEDEKPFARVLSVEGGAEMPLTRGGGLRIGTSVYRTSVSDDLAFYGPTQRFERVGPSRRIGWVVHATARPSRWLVGALAFNWMRTVLDDPQSAHGGMPNFSLDALSPGDALPGVPRLSMRFDLKAEGKLFDLGKSVVNGRASLGLTVTGRRPLHYDLEAQGFAIADARLLAWWSIFELGLDVYNLFNTRYARSEWGHLSSWRTLSSTAVPERHIEAGAPFTILATLGLRI